MGLLAGLKKIFKTTTGTPIIFPSSGTGRREAALTNCLNPGDRVLASRFGQFSHLWIDMAKRLGFDVEEVDCEWGTGVPVERYRQVLEADKAHKIKAVLACQMKPQPASPATYTPCARRSMCVAIPALLFVDTVSSLVSIDFRMDEWGVDVSVAGSAKGPDAASRWARPVSVRRRSLASEWRASGAVISITATWSRPMPRDFPYTPSRCRCCTA